jgi:CheY-like chemotaxis protein
MGMTRGILPAIALTAFVQKDDAHLALLAGFQVHLPKPVDPHELTSAIARLAGRRGYARWTGNCEAQRPVDPRIVAY